MAGEEDRIARWKRLEERSSGHEEGGDLGIGSKVSQNDGVKGIGKQFAREVANVLLTIELTDAGEKCIVIPKGILLLDEGKVFGFAFEKNALIHSSDNAEGDKVNVRFPNGSTKKFDRRGLAVALKQYFREVATTE